uniref:Uncharacterized protein n=1 Tax=Moniliophthora roreri TaxID=221103 RepID=A0A0W0FBV7_MONRR
MHSHSFTRQKILQKAALVHLPIDETAYAFLRGDFQLSKTFTVLKVDKIPPKISPNTKEEINIGDIFPSESFKHIFSDLPSGKHLIRHKYPNQVRDVIPTETSESTVPRNPINTFENKQPHKSDHGRAMRRWSRHMEAKIQARIPKAQYDPTMIPMPENVKFHIELLNNNPSIDSTLFASRRFAKIILDLIETKKDYIRDRAQKLGHDYKKQPAIVDFLNALDKPVINVLGEMNAIQNFVAWDSGKWPIMMTLVTGTGSSLLGSEILCSDSVIQSNHSSRS